MNYKKINNLIGWVVFLIAAITYISTVEPTASFWDCSEFIVSAFKLEVGHPPGAPMFMMIAHLFTMFSDPQNVAVMVNIFSALCSAFTILFLFWTITHLVRRFVSETEPCFSRIFTIMGCGAVGALVYTFSDTFWFSAVEGEVYAASSLLTAIIFWAILKWEAESSKKYANRWLVLIAYITGLSIGIHLLNLLVIPAIVFVYYFKKYTLSAKGIVLTSLIAVVLLGVLVWGVIPLTPQIASWFELLFVNSFGLPINSGLLFFVAALGLALGLSVYYSHKRGRVLLNTIMLGFSMCMLGYGSYAMIIIRSSANLPMDQNKPDNIFSLIKYLNRDQYGSHPLLTGPYYTNAGDYTSEQKEKYIRLNNRYVKKDIEQIKHYRRTYFFPRMWSNDPSHVEMYKLYTTGKTPTFADNLRYFLDYQTGFMYWRYFMWNFVGRQNDMQATFHNSHKGNWISGIKFIDEARLGKTDSQPLYFADNKGANKYYFLPLLLGLLGLLYQLYKDKRGFTLVTLLFFFTGIAVIIYLNQSPNEPRERDYAYAGSFYAFAIWVGMGVACLYRLLNSKTPRKVAAPLAVALSLPAPIIMAQQNWDDHDRSGRYIATDFGYNILKSCAPNALIYTYGDNDTFPLWYNQEVEGVGDDVKVANTMYLYSDWYYAQMMRRSYDAAPLATAATPEKILGETRSYVHVLEMRPNFDLREAMKFVMSDAASSRRKTQSGVDVDIFPSKELRLHIDKEQVIRDGLVMDTSKVAPYISFQISGGIFKNKLAALDFAANNFPQRPIYYGVSGDRDFEMGVGRHLRTEGMVQRLTPEFITNQTLIDVDKSFDLIVNVYRYRGLNDPKVYLDETARRMLSYYRNAFFRLADALKQQRDTVRLRQTMEKYHESFNEMLLANPNHSPYYWVANPVVEYYFSAGLNDYGISLSQKLIDEYRREFYFYLQSPDTVDNEISRVYQGIRDLSQTLQRHGQTDLHKQASELESEIAKVFKN
jgi:hypothetical protein